MLFFLLLAVSAAAQSTEEIAIRKVLESQQAAWNEGEIERFMEGYWKSDSLQFIGRSIRYGWKATLEGYKKGYPNKAAMGTLQFDLWQFRKLSEDVWLVSGKYTLTREKDKPSGPFTLIFRKINGRWLIVYDHTS
jgi:uncharacterized protein (TIGR02246 family)